MADQPPPLSESFSCEVRDDRFCTIRIVGELVPELPHVITQQVQAQVTESGPLAGLLLDMCQSVSFSMVRLAGLIDLLCRLEIPLAVVFASRQQRELADLLHHTLAHRECVDYFTDMPDAWAFLKAQAK
jgi:hypothetical protein